MDVSFRTVENVRRRCVEEGLALAVQGRAASDRRWRRNLDGVGEAKLVVWCCSEPPWGRTRWTLELLGDAFMESDEFLGAWVQIFLRGCVRSYQLSAVS